MVVYGEVLFLENALIGGLILWLTRQLCRAELPKTKLIMGSVLCGLYSFTIFQSQIHWIWSMLEKLLFSMILIRHCFGRRGYGLKLLVFYGVSFLMGGITMGIFGLMSVPALSANGSMYIEKMTFVHLLSGTVATLLAIRLFLALIREHRYEIQTKRQVIIGYQGNEFCVQGFLDTGNRLMDPETGLPVCLISPQLWSTLMGEKEPMRWITYRGATGFEGLLAIMEPDRIQIEETNGMRTCETVLGTGLRMEGNRQWDGCHILLNGCFAEGCIGFGGENVS
ncbi:MAG: sigma-E processing peptidase SpoIIGA [Firmicutes bacterium]|nr:sigma-E processing peptidase SpoIIGA [Bacillota bacterium]